MAASGDTRRALELLTTAADGFAGSGATWEAAVTGLDLSRVLLAAGDEIRARSFAQRASAEFKRVGSVRELSLTDELLGR